MKSYVAAAIAALSLAGIASSAQAAPALGGLKSAAAQEALVEKTHGVHAACRADRHGWHRSPRWGVRTWCGPVRHPRPWHHPRRRWH